MRKHDWFLAFLILAFLPEAHASSNILTAELGATLGKATGLFIGLYVFYKLAIAPLFTSKEEKAELEERQKAIEEAKTPTPLIYTFMASVALVFFLLGMMVVIPYFTNTSADAPFKIDIYSLINIGTLLAASFLAALLVKEKLPSSVFYNSLNKSWMKLSADTQMIMTTAIPIGLGILTLFLIE